MIYCQDLKILYSIYFFIASFFCCMIIAGKYIFNNHWHNFFKQNYEFDFSIFLSLESDKCPEIIERTRWGAKPWKNLNYLVTPLLYVIIHHTTTQECNRFGECADMVKKIQSYHMEERKFDDIGYSYVIPTQCKKYLLRISL